jgi:hypothetical protein
MALDPPVIKARIRLRVCELKLLAAETAVELFAEGRTLRSSVAQRRPIRLDKCTKAVPG